MATEVIHTIGAGETYTTLTSWESTEQRDLVADDEIAVAELKDEDFDQDLQINGWTVDATRYLIIRAQSGAEYDHVTDGGAKVFRSANFGADIYQLTYFEDISFGHASYSDPMFLRGNDTVRFNRCYITCTGVLSDRNYSGNLMNSCIVHLPDTSSTADPIRYIDLENCTVICDNTDGQILRDCACNNTIVYNSQASPTWGNFFSCTGDYNASTDTSAPGANAVDNLDSAEFVNAASDWHIKDVNADIYHAGSVGETLDFDGVAFHATTPSIGALEFVAVGGGGKKGSLNKIFNGPFGGPIA